MGGLQVLLPFSVRSIVVRGKERQTEEHAEIIICIAIRSDPLIDRESDCFICGCASTH